MIKFIILVICLISTFTGLSTSTNIECSFLLKSYSVVGFIYQCLVKNNPNILTEESAEISRISGTHELTKSNDDVLGFHINSKTIQVFPKGLEEIFKNLKLIWIQSCQLKEIHQSDLIVFPNLVYFNLLNNDIEVIEEGIFDFNPNLILLGIQESKIIHIDPNVFDHLTNLKHFWLSYVPCIAQSINDSKDKVQEAIKVIKSKCSHSKFLSIDSQLKNLEVESKTLNLEAITLKIQVFETSFKRSKFSKFRPLNYKFEHLKQSKSCSNCRQLENIGTLDSKVEEMSKNVDELKKIIFNFKDFKASQCSLTAPINEVKSLIQNALSGIRTSINSQESECTKFQNILTDSASNVINKITQVEAKVSDFKSDQVSSTNALNTKFDKIQKDHGAVLSDIKVLQNDAVGKLSSSLADTFAAIRDLKLTQHILKTSQDASFSDITLKYNELKSAIKSTRDEAKLSVSDILATLSDHTKLQTEAKDSFVKIRIVQNEIKKSLNDLNVNRNDNLDDKFSAISDKVESFGDQFKDLEGKMDEKLEKNNKELTTKFHKMSINFDEKVKSIEKRLMKKFEDILEEKLEKFFNKN
ncbi:unnamed protein product [Chironomus riparius]|uniref:Uncharacterized protein n=1 Tax=Chironomus riparius TaxID=315576 RepID=A0A9N9WXU8_9DIPT|nr:unnamed protein product [Chironomus riparius]